MNPFQKRKHLTTEEERAGINNYGGVSGRRGPLPFDQQEPMAIANPRPKLPLGDQPKHTEQGDGRRSWQRHFSTAMKTTNYCTDGDCHWENFQTELFTLPDFFEVSHHVQRTEHMV